MDSITHCPPVRRIAFQYLMEATQQEGLTGSCLGMHSCQAIKAFSQEKISYSCFHREKYRMQMFSHREGIWEESQTKAAFYLSIGQGRLKRGGFFNVSEGNSQSLVIIARLHRGKKRGQNQIKSQICRKRPANEENEVNLQLQ